MKKINFIHISDTHIGLNRFGKTNEFGCNCRGEDFLNSFRGAIEDIKKLKPDFILHSGDLFDSVVVADKYKYEVQNILQTIECPMVIILGNHSTPKTTSSISPVMLLSPIKNISIIYGEYKRVKLLGDRVCIHAIPHIIDPDTFRKTLSAVKLDEKFEFNIAMTHGALPFGAYVCMEEGHMIPQSFIDRGFDYIALGDYHITKKIHERCYYPGGTDVFKVSEMGDKNFLEIDLDKNINVNIHKIKTRPCLKISINCKDKGIEEIYSLIEKDIENKNIKDNLIFLELLDVDSSIKSNLDKTYIKKLFKDCFYIQEKIIINDKSIDKDYEKNDAIGDIRLEWKEFSSDDEELMKIGQEYIDFQMEKT